MLYVVLKREEAGPKQVIDKEHLGRELPPEEHWPSYGVAGENADHLPMGRLRRVSITSIIGLHCLQAQCSRNVFRSENSRSILDSEAELERTRRSPGGRRMVELEYHPGIVKLPRRHKRQQGVMLDQSHRVPKSGVSSQRRDVVVQLSMKVSGSEIDVPRYRGLGKKRLSDPRSRR